MKTVCPDGEGGIYIVKTDREKIEEYLYKGYVIVEEGLIMHYLEKAIPAHSFNMSSKQAVSDFGYSDFR